MKDTHFLYSIATLAFGSIFAIFASYATDTLPRHTPRTPTPVIAATLVAKDCGCCSKITAQDLKTFRQRNEALRKQRQAYAKATELLKQHGIKEGLRRIKQSHPEIASQFERFITEATALETHQPK